MVIKTAHTSPHSKSTWRRNVQKIVYSCCGTEEKQNFEEECLKHIQQKTSSTKPREEVITV